MTSNIVPSSSINSQSDFIRYIQNNSIGERNLSIRGLAGLCEVEDTSIIRGAAFSSSKLAEKLLAKVFHCADLQPSGFDAQTAWLVIEYFAYESKAKAEGAKRLARLFGSIGIQTCFDMASNQTVQPQRQLAPQRDLIDYIEAAKSLGIDRDPILLSLFSQRMAEQLGGEALVATQQVIATVRAHELGYSAKEIGNGSTLGTFIKKQGCPPTGKAYHGNYRVNVYDLTEDLDRAIHLYFC
jgi:hypothetical protein